MKLENLMDDVCKAIEEVREKKPLIEQITNYVTINDCANVTLSIGASPVMGDGFEEVDQMTEISDAIVINYGAINGNSLKSMIKAGKRANEKNIGIVFDPVGAGATKFRNEALKEILKEVHMTIIKGNASEILAMSGMDVKTKGVDSSADSLDAVDAAIKVANDCRCVCAVTGKTDVITDGKVVITIENQSELLSYITGTGCMITSLAASFLGATKNPLISAVAGILAMSLSGEMASERELAERNGIATFREDVMNNIYRFNADTVKKRAKIKAEKVDSMYSMYLVTDEGCCLGKDFYESVEASIRGGAKVVQLREKNLDTRKFYERAMKLKEICRRYEVPFLINDRIDIALAVDADGVHLGQSDMPIETAKKLIGCNKIVGISAGNLKEALEAQKAGADYIGVGAVFSTSTKGDADDMSMDVIKEITENIYIPVLAIGGIKVENVCQLEGTDIDGICVISDILKADDCEKRTEALIDEFAKIY